MKVQRYSTRVKAPATTKQPPHPLGLPPVVQHDTVSPNLKGRLDDSPTSGPAPNQPPIRRVAAEKPKEREALIKTKKTIGIGTWNVRTLYQSGKIEILLNQMDKFRWEILGVCETHWTDSGEFTIDGYKILCSGNENIHRAGVALILTRYAQKALLGYNPISPRIISARFKTKTGAITIIQVYAPNTGDPDPEVDDFYDQLQAAIKIAPKSDILMILGDFNAKVGDDHQKWEDVIGGHGYGKMNSRGEKLLTFCAVNNLYITNTMYKQKSSRQWTWESPDQKTHNKIDFIIINKKQKHCVTNSRSFPSADVGSDHQLVLANIRLKFKLKSKSNIPKRYDIFRLKDPETKRKYQIEIGGKFGPLLSKDDTDVDSTWEDIKTAFNTTSESVLGIKKPQQSKPWISAEVLELCNERS